MQKSLWCTITVMMILLITTTVIGQTTPKIGIRGGVGTDINLGLAYGLGGNYLMIYPNNCLELGVLIFGGSFEEKSDEGFHTYEEKTSITLFGFMANYLIGYAPLQRGRFFIAGVGLANINVEWEEKSETDESLGTFLPGGGSMQSEEGSTGGMVFNLGIGNGFSSGWDIRVELPVIMTFSAPGEAAGVVPTLIVTLGYRF